MGSRLFQLDATISVVDDFPQQVPLTIGLLATTRRTEATVDIPPSIALLPMVIQLVVGKQIVKRYLQGKTGALQVTGKLEETMVEFSSIDVLADIGRIVEQRLHQPAASVVTLVEFIEKCLCG